MVHLWDSVVCLSYSSWESEGGQNTSNLTNLQMEKTLANPNRPVQRHLGVCQRSTHSRPGHSWREPPSAGSSGWLGSSWGSPCTSQTWFIEYVFSEDYFKRQSYNDRHPHVSNLMPPTLRVILFSPSCIISDQRWSSVFLTSHRFFSHDQLHSLLRHILSDRFSDIGSVLTVWVVVWHWRVGELVGWCLGKQGIALPQPPPHQLSGWTLSRSIVGVNLFHSITWIKQSDFTHALPVLNL